MKIAKTIPLAGILISVLSVIVSFNASAHVVVTPNEVLTSQRTTFAVSVPNEHDTPVTAVRLIIPEGLSSVRPYAKQGWDVKVATTGAGETLSTSEITWTSADATVPVNLKDDFLFSAKTPSNSTSLVWKAYETYQSGLTVAWEQAPSDAKDNTPYSVTEVVSQTQQDKNLQEATRAAAQANIVAQRSLYVAIAGVVLGLIAIFLATRKK